MEEKKLTKILYISKLIKESNRKIESLEEVLNKRLSLMDIDVTYVINGCNPKIKKKISFEHDEPFKAYLEYKLQEEIEIKKDLISQLDIATKL